MNRRPLVTTCMSLEIRDMEALDRMCAQCKEQGFTAATKSDVARYAIRELERSGRLATVAANGRSKLT